MIIENNDYIALQVLNSYDLLTARLLYINTLEFLKVIR